MCATPGRGNVPSLGGWNSPSRATFSPALIPSHDYRETRAIRHVWMRVLATSSVSVSGLAITPSQSAATTYVGGTDDELEALWGRGSQVQVLSLRPFYLLVGKSLRSGGEGRSWWICTRRSCAAVAVDCDVVAIFG
ncbi:MAG: hypothetical protein ACJA0V_002731 [Planctomycetota bacterium]|jgi:hypothetical protein